MTSSYSVATVGQSVDHASEVLSMSMSSETSLVASTSTSTPAEQPSWWFDGRQSSHCDWFIDLKGKSTDHLPDVRAYLIALSFSEKAPEPPKTKVTQEQQDDWRVRYGKKLLIKAWRRGKGFFLDPAAPGRDYSNKHQNAEQPGFGVPWYDDIRNTGPRPNLRPQMLYGDVGLTYQKLPGYFGEFDEALNYWPSTIALFRDSMVKTNLRAPLPHRDYTFTRPGDDAWQSFIQALYSDTLHPAADALDSMHRLDAIDCDTRRHTGLYDRGFIDIGWVFRFKPYNDDGLDSDYEVSYTD